MSQTNRQHAVAILLNASGVGRLQAHLPPPIPDEELPYSLPHVLLGAGWAIISRYVFPKEPEPH